MPPEPWQEAALEFLGLQGPSANLEVGIGGSPPADPRLLGAARVLCLKDAGLLADRNSAQLQDWDSPLSPANEVRTPLDLEVEMACCFLRVWYCRGLVLDGLGL